MRQCGVLILIDALQARCAACPGRRPTACASAPEAAGDLAGTRDAAIVGVASHCLMRVSEVSDLALADVSFRPDGTALATIRRSKTHQYAEGSEQKLCEDAAARQRTSAAAPVPRSAAGRAFPRWARQDAVDVSFFATPPPAVDAARHPVRGNNPRLAGRPRNHETAESSARPNRPPIRRCRCHGDIACRTTIGCVRNSLVRSADRHRSWRRQCLP